MEFVATHRFTITTTSGTRTIRVRVVGNHAFLHSDAPDEPSFRKPNREWFGTVMAAGRAYKIEGPVAIDRTESRLLEVLAARGWREAEPDRFHRDGFEVVIRTHNGLAPSAYVGDAERTVEMTVEGATAWVIAKSDEIERRVQQAD